MSNVLTALLPVIYSAGRIVPREMTGAIGAVTTDFDDKGAALGDPVKVPVAPVQTVTTHTPAATFPAGTDRTPTSVDLTLSQTAQTSWNLTSEQEKSLTTSGVAQELFKQTLEQGIRAIINSMDSYVVGVARKRASRAFGTAGTAPFGSTPGITDLANTLKILKVNGAPVTDNQMSCVVDPAAGVNLMSLTNLFKVNEGGTDGMLRYGVMGKIYGCDIREDLQIAAVTKGTAASSTTNAAGYAVGATSITLAAAGTGAILPGDVITFAGDTNKYVVRTGVTDVSAGGTLVLNGPGLQVAIPASATAITVGNNFTPNLVLHRRSVVLVARPILQPEGPIVEQEIVTDPQTGLSFLLLRVVQDGQTSYFLRCVYDAFAPNDFAEALLLG